MFTIRWDFYGQKSGSFQSVCKFVPCFSYVQIPETTSYNLTLNKILQISKVYPFETTSCLTLDVMVQGFLMDSHLATMKSTNLYV